MLKINKGNIIKLTLHKTLIEKLFEIIALTRKNNAINI